MSTSTASVPSVFEGVFNHIVLPPRLPSKKDTQLHKIENALTDRLLNASRALRDHTNVKYDDQWNCIRRSLETCKVANVGGKLNKATLLTQLRNLQREDILILHIAEQNAGLLVRRHHDAKDENVTFEALEASPLSEDVLASENALQWDFPGCAVAVPLSMFNDSSFQENLSNFLEQASTESIKRFAAKTNKAGSFAKETRDTIDPSLITQMLMTLLEVNGYRHYPPLLRKRVRDDVCWNEGAENPWRRSAFWLVLRVGVQRHLCTLFGGEMGRVYYKFLMCLVLASLLDDSREHLSPDLLAVLKAKLGRRIVKLTVDKDRGSSVVRPLYDHMFTKLGTIFYKSMQSADEHINTAWTILKRSIRRPIPFLPRRAEQRDLFLTLPNSGAYLSQVLTSPLYLSSGPRSSTPWRLPVGYEASSAVTSQIQAFSKRYFTASMMETDIECNRDAAPVSMASCEKRCIELARNIDTYLNTVENIYDSNPEQKSIMLLTVMELWMSMDECAIRKFELLKEYSPGFPTDILDVLQLPRFQEMCRLQKIQLHLQERQALCNGSHKTIFDDPAKGCFADRYFSDSENSSSLQELRRRIEAAAELARRRKEQEWEELSAKYKNLVGEVAASTCLYITDDFQPSLKVHDGRRCRRCFLHRQADRMRIDAHEHPLPSSMINANVVVFELGCPKAFAAYRDATWKILGRLATLKQMEGREPQTLLRDYSELKEYNNTSICRFSLASTTKSFLKTHYSTVRFPANIDDVCLPNGLKFGYFDTLTKVWPARQARKPSFAHHFHINIPKSSPFSSLQFSPEFAPDASGPSSYEIIASQSRCPSGLNVHEFMAYQALFSGKHSRWLSMLIELGSSNLNFSTEATMLLVSQLTLQAGPMLQADPRRAVHRIFRDQSFCRRLIEQLDLRLGGMSSNWRENYCMEMIITLILRLLALSHDTDILSEAARLLENARRITFNWIGQLRWEINNARDASISQKCSRYALWAAMLCRRTFVVHADSDEDLQPPPLRCFIECSIALQDNLVNDPAALPRLPKNALVRDLKMVYRMRLLLRRSLEANPESLLSAINTIWPEPEGGPPRNCSGLTFLPFPDEWWIQLTVDATKSTLQQTVHYHLLEGHLLVDGQTLGKLPSEHRKSVVLEQLFGNQNLLVYPSGLPGMSYSLSNSPCGHQIHIGFRNGDVIVRARVHNTLLELIPSRVFNSQSTFDLPASLVEKCVHWLDINTGIMEIRQQPDIWTSKPGNWLLNVHTRLAQSRTVSYNVHTRLTQRRAVSLVDPQSSLFRRIGSIFDRFEYHQHLTVYQPARTNLTVEIRRMEMSFTVNARNLLESSELQSEIDPDQDAGTWYGLNSKLVLRDPVTPRHRSIIVPLGPPLCKRNLFHVAVDVVNTGIYGKFIVNDVLGRLDCAAEPLLLYTKAQFHAFTSFVVADPLTGRTGTEEALHCLRSGYCQPWTPLNKGPLDVLTVISRLTPQMVYYPKDLKAMQKVSWNDELTTTIQHGGYTTVIEAICTKSEQLTVFAHQKTEAVILSDVGEPHLLRRSYLRRSLYERPCLDSNTQQAAPDFVYDARDRYRASQGRFNVFETTSIIRKWPSKLPTTTNLAGVLQNWPTIGGFNGKYDKVLLSEHLDVDFALEWGSLVNTCRNFECKDSYRLMFLFALLSFANNADMDMIRTLIAFSVLEGLKELDPPEWPCYMYFRQHQIPRSDYILQLIKPCCISYPGDERSTFQFNLSHKQRRKLEAIELAHEQQVEEDSKSLVEFLLCQWPNLEPTVEDFDKSVLIDIPKAMEIVRPEWQRFFQNLDLSRFIEAVQHVLDCHRTEVRVEPPKVEIKLREVYSERCRGGEVPTLSLDLISKSGPTVFTIMHQDTEFLSSPQKPTLVQPEVYTVSHEIQKLEATIDTTIESKSHVRQRYGQDLRQSLAALKILKSAAKQQKRTIQPAKIPGEISKARTVVRNQFHQLCAAFGQSDPCVEWLQAGGLWPCVTPVALLQQLRSKSATKFGSGMKESIVRYALSITNLQHLIRIEDAYLKGNVQRFSEEEANLGHENWKPQKYTDWLLLEIDANILIRTDQVDVALATIFPASRSNSVLQMNMGQGKTSVIMPMVSAVLADGKNLPRVVVPKSLLLQTAQLLHARLGGLLGREVRHVPFSRKTSTKVHVIEKFHEIHIGVLKSAGVMVALPEHSLSFLLSGLQRLSDKRITEANSMVKVQAWIRKACRDVLDECDFTLAVRTQLIYPTGSQATVDGSPHRWETSEVLLRLVEGHLWNLQHEFPRSIDVVRKPQGGFPVVYFTRTDVEDALITRLINDICSGRTSIIPIRDCTPSDRLAIKQFISSAKVRQGITDRVRKMFPDRPAARQNIYLLRGLLVHRILLLALKKRWNVQYGLHPSRDPMAVPFHAKGVPSEQAEWGHPDVAIIFTVLAFYYTGLDIAQLRQSLEHVLKSDDPSCEYDRWTHSTESLPDSLREWNAINVDDEAQLSEIWQHVRYNLTVVDYFLNNFVFPKHAKQFPTKLQASGWDIPGFSPDSQLVAGETPSQSVSGRSHLLTTGFSGTNDNRTMLPLTIRQEDLPSLSHTNAEVLTYLLQPRSRKYVIAANSHGKHLSELELLSLLRKMNIRLLIDAGAHILEMDNFSLAKAWLKVDSEAPAAVYFSSDNKPFVLYRRGHQVPLVASPFADNLGQCLVYLDEAHTRGTDLKMPANARGALTLGLGQTKDHTVQAAMRLRQLATSQSVVFFAPPEVHQCILDLRNKKSGDLIDSYDVICWLLQQTCDGIEQLQPLYYSQGADFCRRIQAAYDNPNFLEDTTQRETYVSALRQSEQQTLEQLYEPKTRPKKIALRVGHSSPGIAAFWNKLQLLRKGFQDTGNAVHGSALQEVEQEREIAYEVEAVREVQRPVHFSPHSFSGLHHDILSFVKTGRLAADSGGYEQAFVTLRRTAVGHRYEISKDATGSNLYVSMEFTRTVKLPLGRYDDSFQRQVNWILWSSVSQTALIVNPEEAELLIPLVQDAEAPRTHLLTYAAPVTRRMLHFNDLNYYAIPTLPKHWKAPTWLTIELGIFAGRLYFEYDEYSDLCKFLGRQEGGMKLDETYDEDMVPVQTNGVEAVPDGTADEVADEAGGEEIGRRTTQEKSFTNKPLTFLQEWLTVRRKGQDFAHTPMGHVCQDKPLTANHPFFGRAEYEGVLRPKSSRTTQQGKKGAMGTDGAVDASEFDDDVGDEDGYDDSGDDEDSYDADGDADVMYRGDVPREEDGPELQDRVDFSDEAS